MDFKNAINCIVPLRSIFYMYYITYIHRNCVATVDLGIELNLTTINSRTRNSEYNPARFNGLVMRIREPRTTALIFKSGKIVCTGARNESDVLLAAKKFARIIQKLSFNVSTNSFSANELYVYEYHYFTD